MTKPGGIFPIGKSQAGFGIICDLLKRCKRVIRVMRPPLPLVEKRPRAGGHSELVENPYFDLDGLSSCMVFLMQFMQTDCSFLNLYRNPIYPILGCVF